jgi:flagellin-like hook-associated protein FlgL
MRHAGCNVTRSMIIEHVWNLTFDTTTNVVDVYINFLNNQTTQLAEQANTIGGADLSKVISDLVNAQTAREATLGAVSKTQQTNLFDYIK